MKKFFLFLCILASMISNAQNAIPNPGFETWNANPNYDDPAGWGTINGLTYFLGVRTVTKTTDKHSGSYAIKLQSKTVPLQGVAPGIAATGTINPNTQAVDGGVIYTKRPISITGWYKYVPNGVDTGSVEAVVSKWNTTTHQRDEVGRAEFVMTSTVNSYTQFTANFTYSSANYPDTLVVILLTSSAATNSPDGTQLFIDDLDLVLCNPSYAATTSTTNATCTANNGTATVNPSNGNAPYSFAWSNSGNTNQITNVTAGTYNVTVTDGNGCTVSTSATVNANNNPLNVTTTTTQSSCSSATGSATATVTGGAQPYNYLWSTTATSATISNVGAGTYDITITDSNGCSGTGSASVTTPNGPSATVAISNASCFANPDGAITVTVTGGTLPVTYLWNDGVTTQNRTGLGAANYTVTITDANSCSFQASGMVTQPPQLTVTETHTSVSCFGANNGTISLTAAGGTPTYNYAWSSLNGTNLPAGTYTATVTDANSCSVSISATITQPSALTLSLTATDATSSTATDGSVTGTTSGGTSPYTFVWTTGATTQNLTGVAAGAYCLTVTDANNCTTSSCDTVSAPSAIGNIANDVVALYPNPAANRLTIEMVEGNYTFAIYNLEGKLVEERNITGNKAAVDVRLLPDGLYTYQLKNITSSQVSAGRLQIQK